MQSEHIKAWVQASRPPFYVATLIPLFIGWILGRRGGESHPWLFFFVLLGSLMIHLATNLANDYFDHIQGADKGDSIGGSRVIQEGRISPAALRRALFILYGSAAVLAAVFMATQDLWALSPLILLAFFSSYFYVAPPIRFGYRGLGELFAGVSMGPVMVVGTEWVIAGRPSWEALCISLPVGFMVASILYYQNLPDMATDESVGKYTLAVRLGREGALRGLFIQWAVIYLGILALTATGLLSPTALWSLATLPLFVKMIRKVLQTVDWVELDRYGYYVRLLYLLNGIIIILAL
jgi:1,4-dihydroxy-2-naphthoate octaprenyltransferase